MECPVMGDVHRVPILKVGNRGKDLKESRDTMQGAFDKQRGKIQETSDFKEAGQDDGASESPTSSSHGDPKGVRPKRRELLPESPRRQT